MISSGAQYAILCIATQQVSELDRGYTRHHGNRELYYEDEIIASYNKLIQSGFIKLQIISLTGPIILEYYPLRLGYRFQGMPSIVVTNRFNID